MGNSLGVRISELFCTQSLQQLLFDLEMTTNFSRILRIFPFESIQGYLEKCTKWESENLNMRSHWAHSSEHPLARPTEPGTGEMSR